MPTAQPRAFLPTDPRIPHLVLVSVYGSEASNPTVCTVLHVACTGSTPRHPKEPTLMSIFRTTSRSCPAGASRLVLLPMATAAWLLLAACGSTGERSQPSATAPSSPDATAAISVPTGEPAEVTALAVDTATDQRSPQDVLAEAIDQLGTVYEFQSEVIVDASQASLATGRRLDDALEVVLDQKGTPILYRSIAGKRWLQLPDGSWDRLADSAAPIDPLARLQHPTNLGLTSSDGTKTTMLAVYDAAVLSLANSGELTVTMTITDGKLSNIDYKGQLNGKAVEMHTSFSPTSNVEPIPTP